MSCEQSNYRSIRTLSVIILMCLYLRVKQINMYPAVSPLPRRSIGFHFLVDLTETCTCRHSTPLLVDAHRHLAVGIELDEQRTSPN